MLMPGDWVILFNFIRLTRMLSSFTARLFIALRRSFSGIVETSDLVSRMMSVRRSVLQQWNKAVGIILAAMTMPILYISHCLMNADHWSGSHPIPICGGSNFSLAVDGVKLCADLSWPWSAMVRALAKAASRSCDCHRQPSTGHLREGMIALAMCNMGDVDGGRF